MRSATDRLCLLVVLLACLAGGVLALPSSARPAVESHQRRVGGLGGGAAVHPARCGHAFDARVHPHCSWRHGVIPGADRYCPLHDPAAPRR